MKAPTYSIIVDQPLWYTRRPLLAWAARLFGIQKRWQAAGDSPEEFRKDLDRLIEGLGGTVDHHGDSHTITLPPGRSFTCTCISVSANG